MTPRKDHAILSRKDHAILSRKDHAILPGKDHAFLMLKERDIVADPSTFSESSTEVESTVSHFGKDPRSPPDPFPVEDHPRWARVPAGSSPAVGPETCAGCGCRIEDRFYLHTVDRSWHTACLKCYACGTYLEGDATCFARMNRVYCKEDYYRIFSGRRCNGCGGGIGSRDLVMRARDLIYHPRCFTCFTCRRLLVPGDVMGIRGGNVYCRPHFDLAPPLPLVDPFDASGDPCTDPAGYALAQGHSPPLPLFPSQPPQKGRPRKRKAPCSDMDPLATHRSLGKFFLQLTRTSSNYES
ncbi:unnamed protein product [Darwinula stevensoni]|uniref:LIM zinc-binding domain-containing protein n=1 Tax=Darwinula stevensoni TaxID=69355 RepID=A0A7R9ABL4_9CRUS|nr:unnamed protein product [Darwinula stevensoni]CAG0899292.1 unnamed protein product [Darwinula stevensoni]